LPRNEVVNLLGISTRDSVVERMYDLEKELNKNLIVYLGGKDYDRLTIENWVTGEKQEIESEITCESAFLPLPYLLIDWNSPSVRHAKEDGFELLDIKVKHCGENLKQNEIIQSIKGDTLVVSFVIEANCCNEFLGRISADWGERLDFELYTIGNNICFCDCRYRFEYTLKMKNKKLFKVDRYRIYNNDEKKLNGT